MTCIAEQNDKILFTFITLLHFLVAKDREIKVKHKCIHTVGHMHATHAHEYVNTHRHTHTLLLLIN